MSDRLHKIKLKKKEVWNEKCENQENGLIFYPYFVLVPILFIPFL